MVPQFANSAYRIAYQRQSIGKLKSDLPRYLPFVAAVLSSFSKLFTHRFPQNRLHFLGYLYHCLKNWSHSKTFWLQILKKRLNSFPLMFPSGYFHRGEKAALQNHISNAMATKFGCFPMVNHCFRP